MINYNELFFNTLEYLKIQKMSLIPNTLFNEDAVMELKTVNEKGELYKIVIDFENQYARLEKIQEETRVVDGLDFELFKMNRNMIHEDELLLEFIKSQRDQLYEECLKKVRDKVESEDDK